MRDVNKPVVLNASLKVTKHFRHTTGIKETYVERQRHPHEALPNRINVMLGEYVPPKDEVAREGAYDHKKYKSRGFSC